MRASLFWVPRPMTGGNSVGALVFRHMVLPLLPPLLSTTIQVIAFLAALMGKQGTSIDEEILRSRRRSRRSISKKSISTKPPPGMFMFLGVKSRGD